MRKIEFEKSQLIYTLVISLICGMLFGADYWIFESLIPEVKTLNSKITCNNIMASVFYGGVVEEVLIRLFLMSIISLIIWKVFYKKYSKKEIPTVTFVIANIISAFIFAFGHLPATLSIFSEINVIVLFRMFLYNGGLGLVFGHLYRKSGIQYAMFSHIVCHLVSKLIWFLFV